MLYGDVLDWTKRRMNQLLRRNTTDLSVAFSSYVHRNQVAETSCVLDAPETLRRVGEQPIVN